MHHVVQKNPPGRGAAPWIGGARSGGRGIGRVTRGGQDDKGEAEERPKQSRV